MIFAMTSGSSARSARVQRKLILPALEEGGLHSVAPHLREQDNGKDETASQKGSQGSKEIRCQSQAQRQAEVVGKKSPYPFDYWQKPALLSDM